MRKNTDKNTSQVKAVWEKENSISRTESNPIKDKKIDELLGSIFCPGPFYYYIFDFKLTEFTYISPSISSVLGYSPEEFTVNNWMKWIDPEDRAFIPVKEEMAAKFLFQELSVEKILNYKISYDYRTKKKNGEYVRILHQAIATNLDENGKISKVLGVHSDISHLKKNSDQNISFIGINGEPSYYSLKPDKKILKKYHLDFDFSIREIEVLKLIATGKMSKEIAKDLSVSEETIKSHRKNILIKSKKKNILEVVVESLKRGLI